MTRGTFYLIGKDETYQSTEFNGDMYGSPKDDKDLQETGNYKNAVLTLKEVKDKDSFVKAIEEFNKSHHNYTDDELVFDFPKKGIKDYKTYQLFDFTDKYFDWFFSDYLYFKNVSGDDVWFKEIATGELIMVGNGEIATFNFGKFIETI